MKPYPQMAGGCRPGRSSNGVDLVVNSHIQTCGHFTSCTKNENQTTVGGRKKKTNTDLERQNSGR